MTAFFVAAVVAASTGIAPLALRPPAPAGRTSLATTPDDSETARRAALARLRAAAADKVCGDPAPSTRSYGTSCASREFRAPALLEAPRIRWTFEPGWWAVWSPWVSEGLVLTGSCNNDTFKGLSAIDVQTGKPRWRLASICDEGSRAGSMGGANFQPAGPGKVLFGLTRTDGKPVDWYLIDLKTGRIDERLVPVKRGPTNEVGGAFTVLTSARDAQRSYLNVLSPKLDRIQWRFEDLRYTCDKLDRWCSPVFSASAASDGMLFISMTSLQQPEPPTRELHAFDLATGTLKWKHTAQPVRERDGQGRAHRSVDGPPMVVAGKVIIRIEDEEHHALRAFDANSGRMLWTTDKLVRRVMEPRGLLGPRELETWIGAGNTIVGFVESGVKNELMAWSAADGRLLWSRETGRNTVLTASSGGVFYTAHTPVGRKDSEPEILTVEGFEAATGTKLWSTTIDGHNRPFTNEWTITPPGGGGSALQGPSWRIGPDGAIYGVTLKGVYKLQ